MSIVTAILIAICLPIIAFIIVLGLIYIPKLIEQRKAYLYIKYNYYTWDKCKCGEVLYSYLTPYTMVRLPMRCEKCPYCSRSNSEFTQVLGRFERGEFIESKDPMKKLREVLTGSKQ